MTIIEQSHEILQIPNNSLILIEQAGRTCYKSEGKISEGSAEKFAKMLLKSNHESVLEHISISVRFITNRGVTHELVRHRLCAFSQESTRYVKYDKGNMEFINPVWIEEWTQEQKDIWKSSLENSELMYKKLMESGSTAERAREVLPNSLKTEIVVTANLRQWRHIFNLRCHKRAHPQIRSLMINCCRDFKGKIPILFDDIILD